MEMFNEPYLLLNSSKVETTIGLKNNRYKVMERSNYINISNYKRSFYNFFTISFAFAASVEMGFTCLQIWSRINDMPHRDR